MRKGDFLVAVHALVECFSATRELGGGLIYDAIIAHSCASAGATILLTWDVQDFLRVAPSDLTIQDPLS